MALTDLKVCTAKPRDKAYKLADDKGLYLLINPNGSKYWRFKFRYYGKEKALAIGVYDDVTLAQAREKRDEARKMLANDIDPGIAKQNNKRAKQIAAENSFEAMAREWHAKFTPKWKKDHAQRILIRFEKDVFPWLGRRPIAELTAPEVLSVLRRIESRGAVETAHVILKLGL